MNDMDKHSDRVAQQAAEYFTKRRGATPADRREREQWLEEDPLHAEAYADFQRIWDRSGDQANDPELQALRSRDLAAVRRHRWFRPQRFLAVAATLVMLVGAGYIVLNIQRATLPITLATELGERRTEVMPDGTEIVLNTDSAVSVVYSGDERSIELVRGEAQFDVAKDPEKPFVVSVDGASVTALGTSFQVRRDAGSTIVTLLEGSVAVAQRDERHVLKPNERAVLSARNGLSIASIDPEQATGWLDGWLRFRGTPLAEVIVESNRYSPKKLRLGDPRLADVQFGGNFRAGDADSIADAASMILPVRIERRAGEIILMPK
ncbi:FecR family protein [Pseudoxanthomonas putridarboris]|uniref:FecR family protein n=1 Tax=Pseudoxanthomonas putridarboris TaxID=752605 RepID=A0ABU9IWK7_9GAMM